MPEVITECVCGELPPTVHEFSEEPDAQYPSLKRAHCSCGWATSGYVKGWLAQHLWERHLGTVDEVARDLAS